MRGLRIDTFGLPAVMMASPHHPTASTADLLAKELGQATSHHPLRHLRTARRPQFYFRLQLVEVVVCSLTHE